MVFDKIFEDFQEITKEQTEKNLFLKIENKKLKNDY